MPETRHNVATVHPQIQEDIDRHELNVALEEGVTAMREAAREYRWMKPNPGELEKVEVGGGKDYTIYDLRIERSDLPNPWADTIANIARLPFRSQIHFRGWNEDLIGRTVTDDDGEVVERIPGWIDDIDGSGASFDEWAAKAFHRSLTRGLKYAFVDNDPRSFPDAASRRLAEARPIVVGLDRRDVTRITLEMRGSTPRIKQLVFKQTLSDTDISDPNAWKDDKIQAQKVVDAGNPDADKGSEERKVRTRVYKQDAEGKWAEDVELRGTITPDNPTDEMLDIPLVSLPSNRTGPWRADSPFLNTAHTQASIWNHNSEISGCAREAMLTFIHRSGVNADPKTNQPILEDSRNARYMVSTDPQAKAQILEMTGSALKSVRELVADKTAYIEKAHHQIQTERPTGPVTAREITLEGVHASSALEMWVIFHEMAWWKILEIMSLLGGLPERGAVSIPHDFGLPNTGMERNHTLYMAGRMTAANYWPEAMRAGDVDEQKFDLEAETDAEDKRNEATNPLT